MQGSRARRLEARGLKARRLEARRLEMFHTRSQPCACDPCDLYGDHGYVYLSLTFQLSQTDVVKAEMSSTFPTLPVKLSNSELHFFDKKFMRAMSRNGASNCFDISLQFRFAIQLETRLETCLQWLLRSLQLEETEQLITMLMKFSMLQSKCSRVSKPLGTESETCLQRCFFGHYNNVETGL